MSHQDQFSVNRGKRPMPPEARLTSETIGQMAEGWIGLPLPEPQRENVAELVSALGAEMAAMRALPVGSIEPATVYDARQS